MYKKVDRPTVLSATEKEQFVHKLFSAIASHYDRLNAVLSFNQDNFWRRYAVSRAEIPSGGKGLDLCCGTGKLTVELAKAAGTSGSVVGVDFCANMLHIAQQNISQAGHSNITLTEASVLALPFAADTFDCSTVGFALRNVTDMPRVFAEVYRVLKPGGRFVILELSKPRQPLFKSLYFFYFEKILPMLGQSLAKVKGAYQWLPESLRLFPEQEEVLHLLQAAGFKEVGRNNLTGGIVTVYVGLK